MDRIRHKRNAKIKYCFTKENTRRKDCTWKIVVVGGWLYDGGGDVTGRVDPVWVPPPGPPLRSVVVDVVWGAATPTRTPSLTSPPAPAPGIKPYLSQETSDEYVGIPRNSLGLTQSRKIITNIFHTDELNLTSRERKREKCVTLKIHCVCLEKAHQVLLP